MRLVAVLLFLALGVGACSSSSPKATTPSTTTTPAVTAPTTDATATSDPAAGTTCGSSQVNCTSKAVIATVTHLYELGGATPAEAACLAPVTATGKHAVNQAFEAPTDAQTAAAVACAGSEARLRTIASGLSGYLATHSKF